MKLRKQKPEYMQAGFSLAEVSVAMGVVGIVFVSLYSGITSGVATLRLARENERATQIMTEKLDTIRLYSWDKITTPGYIPTAFTATFSPSNVVKGAGYSTGAGIVYTGTVTIENAPVPAAYQANVKQVTVNLTWTTGSLQRQRSMTTFVSKDGMQNYIY